MEFLEAHTGKDAKGVWKNDIDIPVNEEEEATEKSDESENEEDDKSKINPGETRKKFFLNKVCITILFLEKNIYVLLQEQSQVKKMNLIGYLRVK